MAVTILRQRLSGMRTELSRAGFNFEARKYIRLFGGIFPDKYPQPAIEIRGTMLELSWDSCEAGVGSMYMNFNQTGDDHSVCIFEPDTTRKYDYSVNTKYNKKLCDQVVEFLDNMGIESPRSMEKSTKGLKTSGTVLTKKPKVDAVTASMMRSKFDRLSCDDIHMLGYTPNPDIEYIEGIDNPINPKSLVNLVRIRDGYFSKISFYDFESHLKKHNTNYREWYAGVKDVTITSLRAEAKKTLGSKKHAASALEKLIKPIKLMAKNSDGHSVKIDLYDFDISDYKFNTSYSKNYVNIQIDLQGRKVNIDDTLIDKIVARFEKALDKKYNNVEIVFYNIGDCGLKKDISYKQWYLTEKPFRKKLNISENSSKATTRGIFIGFIENKSAISIEKIRDRIPLDPKLVLEYMVYMETKTVSDQIENNISEIKSLRDRLASSVTQHEQLLVQYDALRKYSETTATERFEIIKTVPGFVNMENTVATIRTGPVWSTPIKKEGYSLYEPRFLGDIEIKVDLFTGKVIVRNMRQPGIVALMNETSKGYVCLGTYSTPLTRLFAERKYIEFIDLVIDFVRDVNPSDGNSREKYIKFPKKEVEGKPGHDVVIIEGNRTSSHDVRAFHKKKDKKNADLFDIQWEKSFEVKNKNSNDGDDMDDEDEIIEDDED